MDLDIKINTRDLEQALVFVPQKLEVEFKDALSHIRSKFFKTFREKQLRGRPGINATPGRRGLFAQFDHRKFSAAQGFEKMGFEIFTKSKIARRHEIGETVFAGTNKIPVPLSRVREMWTAKGKLKKKFKRPQDLQNVSIFELANQEYLVRHRERIDEFLPLYVLKNKITVKARLGFMKTWRGLESFRTGRLNRAVSASLRAK